MEIGEVPLTFIYPFEIQQCTFQQIFGTLHHKLELLNYCKSQIKEEIYLGVMLTTERIM